MHGFDPPGGSTPGGTNHANSGPPSEGQQSLFEGYHSPLSDGLFSPETVPAEPPLQPVEQVIPPPAEQGHVAPFQAAPLHPEVAAPAGSAEAAAPIDPFALAIPSASTIQEMRARGRAGAHDLIDMIRTGVLRGRDILIQCDNQVIEIAAPIAGWVMNNLDIVASAYAFALAQEAESPTGLPTYLDTNDPVFIAAVAAHHNKLILNLLNNLAAGGGVAVAMRHV